ncbi:MAG: radical SAM protein, partial [Ilumatobacter sp.]|nr:radical SAM protein [Ilumatobacter sp.]
MSVPLAERRVPGGLVAGTIAFSNVDGPGNRFAVFLQGCNFDCVACHNPHTIPGRAPVDGDHQGPRRVRVPDLLHEIGRAAPFIRGITVSGGEATLQAAFVEHLFRAVKEDPALAALTCFIDSNGAADPITWDRLAPVTDGVMVDLKCLDPEIHRRLTGQDNAQVLASIMHLHERRLLHEVRLLLLAGWN